MVEEQENAEKGDDTPVKRILREIEDVLTVAAGLSVMPGHYILDEDKNVVPVDLLTWGMWFENIDNRRVAETKVGWYTISTVCLGIDHRFGRNGPPLIFETMVFVENEDKTGKLGDATDFQDRYSTWSEAMQGHREVVKRLEEAG